MIASRCAEEHSRFMRRDASDPQFCYELLRRALAEGSADALTYVYQVYQRQVLVWVFSHPRFPGTGESAEYFASAALSSFYFALRGERFHRLPGLPQAMAYLKTCVHTAIVQYLRDQPPPEAALEVAGEVASVPADDTADLPAIWARICVVLPEPADQALARAAFVHDLKPRQIVTALPEQWPDERTVSLALYRIRRILRADPGLRQLLDLPP